MSNARFNGYPAYVIPDGNGESVRPDRITPKQAAQALARQEIVKAYRQWIYANQSVSHGTKSLNAFAAQYRATGDTVISPETRSVIKKVSGRTLRRWVDGFEARGLAGLIDAKNGSALIGHGKIDSQPEMKALIAGLLANKPYIRKAGILAAIRARFGDRLAPVSYTLKKAQAHDLIACPDTGTIRRWRIKWIKENADASLAARRVTHVN